MEKLSNDSAERKISFSENFKIVKNKINIAAAKANRDVREIKLLAATKTVPVDVINYAISQGLACLGENKVQELLEKYPSLNRNACALHMIGHLQTNKVKKLIGKVDMIQSVDSIRLAEEIGRHSREAGVVTNVLVEVNIGRDKNKYGVRPEELGEFVGKIVEIDGISMRGLMTIPPICEKKTQTRQYFSQMYKLFVDIKMEKLDNSSVDVLSMGMSEDYEEAILEGATMLRVGSALFGSRNYNL